MEIKYAEGVQPTSSQIDAGKINTPTKNYSGASVDGAFYGRIGRPLGTRERLRAQGQTHGKNNPYLGACKSRTNKTDALMRRPFSVHSSKKKVREVARALEALNLANDTTQEES